jgi:NAD dependent epimerase/dehydratase family enzyme
MSWVSVDDAVGALYHALLDTRCSGPINVTAPESVTNAQFTTTLGRVLRRPTLLPVPSLALRAVFGPMAEETILGSARVEPRRLRETGYVFRQPTLEAALRHVCGR